MLEDVRFALRQLRKNPGFAVVAVATLGLGIGAATAMFGLIQGVLLSPPPYADPGRLVLLSAARIDGRPYDQGSTVGDWLAWRQSRTIDPPALYRWTFNFMVLPDGSESLGGMVVTTNFFRTLGLTPILGRELSDAEASRPNVPPTGIVIGYDLWQRKFNGDPQVIGKTITLSRMPAPLPIVGVMPPGVRFLPDPGAASEPNYDVNAHVDFFLEYRPDESRPTDGIGNAVARLRDGASLAQARAEAAATAAAQATASPERCGLTTTVSLVQDVLNRDGRQLLVPLFGSVALVFFIACANVAGLLLARGLQRQQEYAMRSALGAGQWRLFRQMLTESVALAVVSSLFGGALAVAIVRVLQSIGGKAVPRADAVTIGWPVLAFGCVAAIVAAGVAGVLPALRASRPAWFRGLSGARSSVGRAERRLVGSIATLQIVLTVALLGGAALLVRTARNLERVRPGYDTEHILAMTVTSVQRNKWQDFHSRALERVAAVPGVSHVAFAWGLPLTGNKWPATIEIPGLATSSALADRLELPLRAITPDYFAVMGMTLAEGRNFRPSDDAQAPKVAVINQALARRYFQGVTPIGRTIRFAGNADRSIEIVGIVSDTKTDALSDAAAPEIYLPLWQSSAFSKHMVVRTAGDPLALAARVRDELHAVDPTAAVEHITTMADIRQQSTAARTFAMRLLTGFAVVATLLAAVGLYGVLSLSVGSRTKEIAVRKAIGAQGRQIAALVLAEVGQLLIVGLVMGTLAALGLGRLLGTLLFDVHPADPIALASASALFAVAALVACYRPIRLAGRVDLMEVLRRE